jgi:hypothetical protein
MRLRQPQVDPEAGCRLRAALPFCRAKIKLGGAGRPSAPESTSSMMAESTSIRGFIKAILSSWLTTMSGPLSVPFGIATIFVPGYIAKALLVIVALVGAWIASYVVWAKERTALIALETRLGELPKITIQVANLSNTGIEVCFEVENLGPPTTFKNWKAFITRDGENITTKEMSGHLGLDAQGDLYTTPLETGGRRYGNYQLALSGPEIVEITSGRCETSIAAEDIRHRMLHTESVPIVIRRP